MAIVTGHHEQMRIGHWNTFVLDRVDDKPLWNSTLGRKANVRNKVPAGERRMLVQATFNRGMFGPGIQETFVPVTALLEAGETYRLNGAVKDDRVVVWVENVGNGARVSSEASALFSKQPLRVDVPVILPQK